MKRNSTYIMTKIVDPKGYAKPAQVGVDITVDQLARIDGGAIISHKTVQGKFTPITVVEYTNVNSSNPFEVMELWHLEPGAYAVVFDQGLLPLTAEENASIIQRSSLNRNGSRVQGSIYDPGYRCDNLGATLYVSAPITIARHARIAQLIIETNETVEVDNLYNGQYQGEKPKGV